MDALKVPFISGGGLYLFLFVLFMFFKLFFLFKRDNLQKHKIRFMLHQVK